MVLDIDKILKKPRNRISRVGIELEGLWDPNNMPKGVPRLDHDASVYKNPKTGVQEVPLGFVAGELPSGPILPFLISRFIKRCYPKRVDHTCGLHIHMSFESPRYYSVLMEEDYYETMKEYLKRWATKEGFSEDHCIWDRLAGKSIFCQDKFWPDLQFDNIQKDHSYYDKKRKGHRYTIVNYCGRLKTIEVRALPMMDTPAQSIRALRHIIDVTNACIYLLARKKEGKQLSQAYVPGEDVYREKINHHLELDPKLLKMIER